MLTVLKAVLEAYRSKRDDIAKFAEELRREVERWHSPALVELEREVQLGLLTVLASSFDTEYGGFGGVPKFPPIAQLELLLMRYFYDGVGLYRKMAEATLDAMALGGVYDHLLGGWYYASQDADVEGEEGGYYRWTLEEVRWRPASCGPSPLDTSASWTWSGLRVGPPCA